MITLDTNLLLRYILEDHPTQSEVARRLIETTLTQESPGFISSMVLCELAWALAYSYRQPRERIRFLIRGFIETRQLQLEMPEIVLRALGHDDQDFADALLHEIGAAYGAVRTLTLDRKFARLQGVDLLV